MIDPTVLSSTGDLQFLAKHPLVIALLILWILAWKGWALWRAARLSHKWWFAILLIANTLGLLEMIYLYFVAKKYTVEAQEVAEVVEVSGEKK